MTGWAAVAGGHTLLDRGAGPHEVEEPERVGGQVAVQVRTDAKAVALLPARLDPADLRLPGEAGEVEQMNVLTRGRVGPDRPRLRPAGVYRPASPVADDELDRARQVRDEGGLHRAADQVAQLVDSDPVPPG